MNMQTVPHKSAAFTPALRIQQSITSSLEKRALLWMSCHTPLWLSSDQLTALGLVAQVSAGVCYALSRYNRYALLLVILCLALNWFGDSMDGTLARVRCQQRPRYGFYVDHMVDVLGAIALMYGLGFSGFLHWQVAIGMLVAFLMLSCESYLTTYALSRFEISQGYFGPTEIRLLLVAGNLALLHSPYVTVFGHKLLLFDLGGSIATVCMVGLALVLVFQHTRQLFREEPLS
jgi:phosphatidylglycerophosphate synthase